MMFWQRKQQPEPSVAAWVNDAEFDELWLHGVDEDGRALRARVVPDQTWQFCVKMYAPVVFTIVAIERDEP